MKTDRRSLLKASWSELAGLAAVGLLGGHDPSRFLYDVSEGLSAHYTNFGGNVV